MLHPPIFTTAQVICVEITVHAVYNGKNTLNFAEMDLLVQELSAAQQMWEDIGRELGVEQDTLRDIRTKYSDPGDCLRATLREKLKRHCITWKYIITILRTPYIGESNLADQLETKYCLSEHSLMIINMQYIIALKKCSSCN